MNTTQEQIAGLPETDWGLVVVPEYILVPEVSAWVRRCQHRPGYFAVNNCARMMTAEEVEITMLNLQQRELCFPPEYRQWTSAGPKPDAIVE